MGSNFFSSMVNPLASLFGHVGSQSTLGKAMVNDPINRATGDRFQPVNGGYGKGNWQGTVAPPNAYAGVPATLAAANTGYGTLPGAAPTQQAQQPRPVGGGQPQPPFSFNTPNGASRTGGGANGGGW
jgi:hypothetical protein